MLFADFNGDFLSDKDVRTASAATKSKHDPEQCLRVVKALACAVVHMPKQRLMADTNARNAASSQAPSKKLMRIIFALMNGNQPKHTCIHRLSVPQNTKAHPAIEE